MRSYDFVVNFSLPDRDADPELYLDALHRAGCDDAAVGIGQRGMIGLDFSRAAPSAEAAIGTAVAAVRAAIPGAELVQAGPDLLGLTQMAEIFGFSRQNMRKYAVGHARAATPFPPPVVLGDPSLWHLAEIVAWMRRNTGFEASDAVLEVAKIAARTNFELERARVKRIMAIA